MKMSGNSIADIYKDSNLVHQDLAASWYVALSHQVVCSSVRVQRKRSMDRNELMLMRILKQSRFEPMTSPPHRYFKWFHFPTAAFSFEPRFPFKKSSHNFFFLRP